MKFYWECRTKGGTSCGTKHELESSARACCEKNDGIIEREIRSMKDYGARKKYVNQHERFPTKLQDYSA